MQSATLHKKEQRLYLSLPQKFLVKRIIIVKSSSLPTIISALKYIFIKGWNMEKLPSAAASPNAAPVLDSIASVAVIVVSMSRP